jgi:hypothetical protein
MQAKTVRKMILFVAAVQFVCTTFVFGIDVSKFGDFDGQKNVKKTLYDDYNVPVTFALSGGGYGEVSNDTAFSQITLYTTTERSAFTITTKGKGVTTSVGDIDVKGPIKSITAKTTNLAGNITIDGSIGSLMLNDVSGGRIITIRSSSNPKAGVLMRFNRISDLSIVSDMPIKSFTAVEWLDTDGTVDDINVPSLGTLSIKGNKKLALSGDFAPVIIITGIGVDPTKPVVGNAKIAGALGNDDSNSTVNGSVSSITTSQLHSNLFVNGNAKRVKIGQPMAILPPESGDIGILDVTGAAYVLGGKDKIKFTDDILYSSEPNLYRLEDIRLYDVVGASWDYSGTYKISGVIRDSGTGTCTIEVEDYYTNGDCNCYDIRTSSNATSVLTTFCECVDGIHIKSWSNSDVGDLEMLLNLPIVAPKYLQLGKQYTDSDSFTGSWDYDLYDDDCGSVKISGVIIGTAKTSCKLLGHEQVTVFSGTYLAAKVVVGLTMTGTMTGTITTQYCGNEDFTGKISVSETQTWWGVPDVGAVKAVTKVTVKVSVRGAGSASLTATETDELTDYDVP